MKPDRYHAAGNSCFRSEFSYQNYNRKNYKIKIRHCWLTVCIRIRYIKLGLIKKKIHLRKTCGLEEKNGFNQLPVGQSFFFLSQWPKGSDPKFSFSNNSDGRYMQQNANQFETGDVKYNLIKRDKKKINRSPLTDARAISLGIKEKKNKKLSR